MAISKIQLKAAEDNKKSNYIANAKLKLKIHKNFKPEWLEDGWIAHPLDKMDLDRFHNKKVHESESLQALIREDGFDGLNGVVHMYWGSEKRTINHYVNEDLVEHIAKLNIDGENIGSFLDRYEGESLHENAELNQAMLDLSLLDAVVNAMEKGKSLTSTLNSMDVTYRYLMKIILHPNFDLKLGLIKHQYRGTGIESLWDGINRRALETLRYADPEQVPSGDDVSVFESELEWIASEQYDAVCRMLSLDSQSIRSFLPNIVKGYSKRLNVYCKRLMGAFNRIPETQSNDLEELEKLAAFVTKLNAPVGNDKTFKDVEKVKSIENKRRLSSNKVLKKAKSKTSKANVLSKVAIKELNLDMFSNV